MPKKFKKKGSPEVHKDLEGFDIRINSFGEMESNFSIDRINEFLNQKESQPQTDEEE